MNNLAATYQAVGSLAKALPLYEETLKRQRISGDQHPRAFISMINLASVHRATGDLKSAAATWRQCLLLRRKHAPNSWLTFGNATMSGTILAEMGQHVKAESLLLEAIQGMQN